MIPSDMYVVCVFVFLQFSKIYGFNFDTSNPIVYVDPEKVKNASVSSYFGYTVVLYPGGQQQGEKWIKIGAPKGTDPKIKFKNSGVVYNCPYMKKCDAVDIHKGLTESRELLNHAWIGGTMDISYKFDRLAICAFRKAYNLGFDYRTVGSCYLSYLNNTYGDGVEPLNDYDKAEPLKNKNQIYQDYTYNYGQGEAGFSAHFPKEENALILGAPGVYNWAGTTIKISDNIYEDPIASRQTSLRSRRGLERNVNVADAVHSSVSSIYELFGYSVNSGYFYGSKKLYYVGSTPKSNAYKGKVVIFEFSQDQQPLTNKESIVGSQLGEYFGASIAVGDINNDGYDDIIIGAPYHAVDTFNEGSVYIFLGQRRPGLKKYDTLYGQQTNGQFGSTLMFLGDIDRDGYGDVAIGAPYEEDFSGVLYIYKGNKQGVEKLPCQIIVGKDISPEIRGFGISISRPADMDNNKCKDLAVGAHLSANAVLLRSSPIVVIKYDMVTFPKVLKSESKNFTLQICFWYTHYIYFKDEDVEIKRTLIVDELIGRAIIDKNRRDNVTIINLKRGNRNCQNVTIALLSLKNTTNKEAPITISLSYELAKVPPQKVVYFPHKDQDKYGKKNDTFCLRCPILDEFRSTRPDTMSIPFTLDCGDDNICQSNLTIEATIPTLGKENIFVVGSMNYVNMKATIKNNGEKAYSTQLEVVLPDIINLRQTPPTCTQQNVSMIICNVDNPLIKEESVELELDMKDVNKNNFETELNIRLKVLTISNNSNTNTIFLKLQLKREADVLIHGKSAEQSFAIGNITHGMPNFTQIYQVEKLGASPLEKVLINITIPHTILTSSGSVNFIKLYQPLAIFNGQPVMCNSDFTYIQEPKTIEITEGLESGRLLRKRRQVASEDIAPMKKKEGIEEITPNRTLYLNCSNANILCSPVLCTGSFESRQTPTVVQIKMMFNASAIRGLLETRVFVLYSTHGSVVIESPSGFIQNGDRPDSVDVSSLFISEIAKKKKVALWIIILSAIAGLLLLVLIIFGLTKAGFFKRSKKEELKNLKAAIEEENEIQESNDDAFEEVANSSNEGLVEDGDKDEK